MSKVVTTDLAERDYGEILGYLNGTLCNPQAAANFSEKVRKAFVTLDGDPLAFPECSEARLKAKDIASVLLVDISSSTVIQRKTDLFMFSGFSIASRITLKSCSQKASLRW